MEAAGFPPEDRPYRSHLTLSRIRPDQDVTAVLDAVPPLGLAMPVDRVVLYRSHLGPGGPRYEEVEAFPLCMTYLALHGFTQRGAMWDEVAGPGRRGVGDPRPAGPRGAAGLFLGGGGGIGGRAAAGPAPPPRCLVGYSMGGRLALAVALDHPGPGRPPGAGVGLAGTGRPARRGAGAGRGPGAGRSHRGGRGGGLPGRVARPAAGSAAGQTRSGEVAGGGPGRPPGEHGRRPGRGAAPPGPGGAALPGGPARGTGACPCCWWPGGDDERYAALAEDDGASASHGRWWPWSPGPGMRWWGSGRGCGGAAGGLGRSEWPACVASAPQ